MEILHSDETFLSDPLGSLEQALIRQYLQKRGYDPHQLHLLSEETRCQLLTEACLFASGKLEEVEARAHWIEDLHGGHPPI